MHVPLTRLKQVRPGAALTATGRVTLLLWLLTGCDRTPPPDAAPADPPSFRRVAVREPETLEQREARLDATVWRDEVAALRHEAVFVRLRDTLRQATNKVAALAGLDFDEILVPAPRDGIRTLDLDIREYAFDDERRQGLPRRAWVETLARLHDAGWRIAQGDWMHHRFTPPRPDQSARSEFSFHLHGTRPPAVRFVLEARLGVEWDVAVSNAPARAHRLVVSNLTVLERQEPPGFARTAVVTPNAPERSGDMINLHPLIVTDLNVDGNEDIVLGGVNQLFLNPGDARFRVTELVRESLFQGCRSAGIVADFNRDGRLDFLAAGTQGVYSNRLTLYPGDGALPFSRAPLVACETIELLAPSVLTAGDLDADGDLDVFVAQYKPPGTGGQLATPYWDARDGYPSHLLVNDGQGHFAVAPGDPVLAPKRLRRTFAASLVDLDGDDDLDLITINDFAGVDLYYNDGRGRFTDESERLYQPHLFGMAVTFGDFDRNGLLDFFVTGMFLPTAERLDGLGLGRGEYPEHTRWRGVMSYGNRLFLASPEGRWVKPPFADEVARTGWSWGVSAGDFDNDGDLEVYCGNGHISGASVEDYDSHWWRHDVYLATSRENRAVALHFARTYHGINTGRTSWMGHQQNALLLDVGGNHYREVAWLMGVAHETDGRAVVSADLNNDGRLDLLVIDAEWLRGPSTGRNRLHVHLNQLDTRHHWIGARLVSTTPGVSPIGARVEVNTGDRLYRAQIATGHSFQSQHPFTVHFGLGNREQVRQLTVHWPNGRVQTFENPAVDRYHRLSP